MFADLAAHNRHLTATDAPLLAGYVQAVGKMHRLAKKSDVAEWERAARVALALGRSLRLTPQSTTDPQSIGRRRKDAPQVSYYDRMKLEPDDDDDDDVDGSRSDGA